ncbi:MAG: hypothetical protein KA715_11935 [Xanthomonadaceae bacterium]|nr:hypothetical protein [Xanthomonadaceae bacterium]
MKKFTLIFTISLLSTLSIQANDRCREYHQDGNQFMCVIDPCCDRNKLQNGNTWTKQGNKYVKNHRWTCSANASNACQTSRNKNTQSSKKSKISIADLITNKSEGQKKLAQIESTCNDITDELAELFSLKEEIHTVYINAQYDKSAYIFVDKKKVEPSLEDRSVFERLSTLQSQMP